MNIQFARNLVPVSKRFPGTAILIGTCYLSTGRRAIGRSPIVRKLENQRKLGQGLDEGLRLPSRTPAETPHSQQNEGLGAGEWLVKMLAPLGFYQSPHRKHGILWISSRTSISGAVCEGFLPR